MYSLTYLRHNGFTYLPVYINTHLCIGVPTSVREQIYFSQINRHILTNDLRLDCIALSIRV